jgi:hypothetical protein
MADSRCEPPEKHSRLGAMASVQQPAPAGTTVSAPSAAVAGIEHPDGRLNSLKLACTGYDEALRSMTFIIMTFVSQKRQLGATGDRLAFLKHTAVATDSRRLPVLSSANAHHEERLCIAGLSVCCRGSGASPGSDTRACCRVLLPADVQHVAVQAAAAGS